MEYAKETRIVILKKPGKSVAKRKIYKNYMLPIVNIQNLYKLRL
jgi:hypothetical protein